MKDNEKIEMQKGGKYLITFNNKWGSSEITEVVCFHVTENGRYKLRVFEEDGSAFFRWYEEADFNVLEAL